MMVFSRQPLREVDSCMLALRISFVASMIVIVIGCARHDPCLVTGTVRSCTGKVIALSAVRLLGGFHQPGRVPGMDDTLLTYSMAGTDGRFSLSAPFEGSYRLEFIAPGHKTFDVPLVVTKEKKIEMNVMLDVAKVDTGLKEIRIKYSFDDGPMDRDTSLVRRRDGSFGRDLESAGRTVRFAVQEWGENSETQSFEGTEVDHFEMLPDGGYAASVATRPDGSCHLVIRNPSDFATECTPTLEFEDSTLPAAQFALASLMYNESLHSYDRALISHLRSTENRALFTWEWPERIKLILARRAECPPGDLRDEYSMEILEVSAKVPGLITRDALEGAARSIPATSHAWVYHGSLPLFAQRILSEGINLVEQVSSDHPSENYRAYILYSEVSDLRLHGEHHHADSLMEVIYQRYRATPVGGNVNIWVSSERSLAPYSILPEFRFESLDDPAVVLTNKGFEGKVLLIDFWNTTCVPCVKMMRSLHRYHDRYHNKGLDILSVSIGDTPWAVRKFRTYRWPMPWANTVVPVEKRAEIIKTFVASTPWVILADRKGIVLFANYEDVETYLYIAS